MDSTCERVQVVLYAVYILATGHSVLKFGKGCINMYVRLSPHSALACIPESFSHHFQEYGILVFLTIHFTSHERLNGILSLSLYMQSDQE